MFGYTTEELVKELKDMEKLGVVDYIVGAHEEDKWIVGVKGGIFHLNNPGEVNAFLLGVQAFAECVAKSKGFSL